MSGSIIKSAEFKTAINDMLKEYGDKCEDAMAEVTPSAAFYIDIGGQGGKNGYERGDNSREIGRASCRERV